MPNNPTLPLYRIQATRHGFQICLVFRDQVLPIPTRNYYSLEVAEMAMRTMQREDREIWQRNSLNPKAEADEHGNQISNS